MQDAPHTTTSSRMRYIFTEEERTGPAFATCLLHPADLAAILRGATNV
ncbi:MAG: hypothetical protein K2H72_08605 [Muribaculaceae bacterium]|nr:hypothetical protein [Muribaculaceae bacterium]